MQLRLKMETNEPEFHSRNEIIRVMERMNI